MRWRSGAISSFTGTPHLLNSRGTGKWFFHTFFFKMTNKKTKTQKPILLDGLEIYTDSEWTQENFPVSVQVLIKDDKGYEGRFLAINQNFRSDLDLHLIDRWKKDNGAEVLFYPLGDDFFDTHPFI